MCCAFLVSQASAIHRTLRSAPLFFRDSSDKLKIRTLPVPKLRVTFLLKSSSSSSENYEEQLITWTGSVGLSDNLSEQLADCMGGAYFEKSRGEFVRNTLVMQDFFIK